MNIVKLWDNNKSTRSLELGVGETSKSICVSKMKKMKIDFYTYEFSHIQCPFRILIYEMVISWGNP